MDTCFFKVFPVLQLNSNLQDLFTDVIVEKVTAAKAKKHIKVHICSKHLIKKNEIIEVENEIKKQLFNDPAIQIKLVECYQLSSQYTPKALMDIYLDSFIDELRKDSELEANLFYQAEKAFVAEDVLKIKVKDNLITSVKMERVKEKLIGIYKSRFDLNLQVDLEYIHTKNADLVIEADAAMQKEVDHIVKTYEQKAKEASQDKENQAKEKKKEFVKKDYKKIDKTNIFYGRGFYGDEITISEIDGEIGEVVVQGQIFEVETREIKSEKTIVTFSITDFTDSIKAKIFLRNDALPDALSNLKKGGFIKMKGIPLFDKYDKEITLVSIVGIKTIADFTVKRIDNSPLKRVELHAHTTMSDMDGVADVKKLISTAMRFGHTALAITDHGVVQAFPDANHATEKNDFKVIYGVEAYIVDDMQQIVLNSKGQSLEGEFVVFDIETTGFSAVNDRIIEIGAVKVSHGEVTERFGTFVNPQRPIPFEIEKLTGINDNMVVDAPLIEEALTDFLAFSKNCVLVAHNAEFDIGFINQNFKNMGLPHDFTVVDTLAFSRSVLDNLRNYKLDTVVETLGGSLKNHHRAVDDANATADVFITFMQMMKKRDITDLDALNEISLMSTGAIKKSKTYHCIILVRNEIGRVNLYRLISMSHLDYFARNPRIPKSQLLKYREGLIVGSACEAGELFQAVINNRPDDEIARIVDFYDYLEIQPIGNNEFMIRSEKINIDSHDQLRDLNRRIVELGERFNKPVCATCDVHFIEPGDSFYRSVVMAGKGFADADDQPLLYLRTTEEMLEEFAYLGEEKAREVVITNTNLIAGMIQKISPVSPDKCPPVIPDSDKMLRNICYEKAYSIYGDQLPQIVTDRLERELNSIISNGFAVMYIIAQKLVWKSVNDGYLVGSRGSVGSSFAAFMAGITEVNSLQAHYLCPKCKYVDFDSDYVKSFSGRSGCDMEDRDCPICNAPMSKEGHDIPFETFLGFKGNKEPDIDLNFSGEYQSKAHEYTEVIFGHGQTYRAGTISTLADKTAFGYAKGYFEDREMHKRNCEIARAAEGCIGVRRSTGQHPGGIIVVPLGMEIYTFTPVQRPANDQSSKTITTHFDYHSIDHNLLKLDILGHDDPTMIRMLQDLTNIDPTSIPLDDPEVLSLFTGLDALKIDASDIGGTKLGSLGIPEFGTEFVMQMLRDTKPKAFSDLVRISGLSHGTDVWLNNAQTLIQDKKAEISTAICTRDDIMTYLINKGLDSELSFNIMESVRKGKGLTDEYEEEMLKHDVPKWYIWSCQKIKYMFPKAHAVAYVMMGFRIAWYKIYCPLAYYAAYFSIRATAFNYELMCQGKEVLERNIKNYKSNPNLTKKEQDTLKDMRIVQEMYARGYEFWPIDIYKSHAIKFLIVDGKLLPPFSSVEGMGEIAAEALSEAAKNGRFVSQDDIKQRAKASGTTLDTMAELGLLGDLPKSNQMSIFDLGL